MLVIVVVAVIVIAAVALVAVPRASGHRLLGGRRRAPHRPVATGPRERARRADRRRPMDERVLLAEGEEIQGQVEARLSARGVAPHRLSGPNPPTAAERLGPQAAANRAPGGGAYGRPSRRRRHAQPPVATELPQPSAPVVAPSGDPTYTDPAYTDPAYTDPLYTDPTYTDPTYTDPLYTAPGSGPPEGPYAEPAPLVPGEPGYRDGRLVGGRRRPIGSRWSPRRFRD